MGLGENCKPTLLHGASNEPYKRTNMDRTFTSDHHSIDTTPWSSMARITPRGFLGSFRTLFRYVCESIGRSTASQCFPSSKDTYTPWPAAQSRPTLSRHKL